MAMAWRSVRVPPGGVSTRLSSILASGWGSCGESGVGVGRDWVKQGVAVELGGARSPGWVLLLAVAAAAWFRGAGLLAQPHYLSTKWPLSWWSVQTHCVPGQASPPCHSASPCAGSELAGARGPVGSPRSVAPCLSRKVVLKGALAGEEGPPVRIRAGCPVG